MEASIQQILFNMSIVSIHATVLSIMIGLSSAYVLYLKSQINTLETEAIAIADDVNNISFSPIWFSLANSAGKFVEKWKNEHQMEMFLGICFMFPSSEMALNDFINRPPLKVYFKDIGLNYTEFKLCLIASLLLRSPFPDRIGFREQVDKNVYGGLTPSPNKIFKNKKELESWMEEVKMKFKIVTDCIKLSGTDDFINGFNWNEVTNIKNRFYGSDERKYSNETLENLKKIPKEFTTNVIKINGIYRSVENKINRINYLEELLPSEFWTKFFLIFSCITFFIGIIIPIIIPSINNICIVWFPALFYCSFLTYFIVKVFGNIR